MNLDNNKITEIVMENHRKNQIEIEKMREETDKMSKFPYDLFLAFLSGVVGGLIVLLVLKLF